MNRQMTWEKACQILDVNIYADDKEIFRAYRKRNWGTHPDTKPNAPAEVSSELHRQFILVQEAYEFLTRPENRPKLKPKLKVTPNHIAFTNIEPGEIRLGSFEIHYDGKQYSKTLSIDYPDKSSFWTVINLTSLTADQELPLRIDIKAIGQHVRKNYVDYITVRLDDDEVKLKVELQMNPTPLEPNFGTGADNMRLVERLVMLRAIDTLWKEHLTEMDHLRQQAGLYAARQIDPIVAYKKEGHAFFESLIASIQHDVVHSIYKVRIDKKEAPAQRQPQKAAVPAGKKVGRNDPCPCGSGKKYKHCCGR